MWPTVFNIPWLNLPIRGYGLMLMIGFLGGTWWAARRAVRVKADPDLVINMGFVALIASVIGARIFYVLHYWDEHFAGRPLRAAFDITAGGMEFYGGFIGGFTALLVYMLLKRVSLRLYLDILAPSLMFGMGMARIGCFLNGCCWGAVCDPQQIPWAVRFPYASPAAYRQWEERVITYPAELITTYFDGSASLIPRDEFAASAAPARAAQANYARAYEAYETARVKHADDATLASLAKARDAARKKWQDTSSEIARSVKQESTYAMSPAALEARVSAEASHTHAVHPVQLYASLDGLLLAILLNAIFFRRKQHGLVTGLLFLFYPIMRFCEEVIRSDNPHDVIGFTISQFISIAIFAGGVLFLIAIYRMPANPTAAKATLAPAGNHRDPRSKAAK
jgi:phosphatidylglycerol:prolipoprotein diacylglycerol transferase